jgi:GTP:adenosylcobinamide-phosphate guanylyltransferase
MLNVENIKSKEELEFAVFCIENVALSLGVKADKVYLALTKDTDILHEYIIPEYEILHTQGKEYIVADIIEVMKERGVKL